MLLLRVGPARQPDVRAEGHLGRGAGGRHDGPDATVGGVEDAVRPGPLRGEQEDVLALGHGPPVDLQVGPRPLLLDVGDPLAVRSHRRDVEGHPGRGSGHQHRRGAGPVGGHHLVVGDVHDPGAVGRPGGRELLTGGLRPLRQRAGRDLDAPDVVAAAPVGGERDVRAVRRPPGLAVVEAAAGQLGQVAAVGADGPDVEPAVAVGLEDDASVGPDVGTSRLVGGGGESPGLPAAGRDAMEEPVEVHHHRAVRGEGGRDVGALGEGHGGRAGLGRDRRQRLQPEVPPPARQRRRRRRWCSRSTDATGDAGSCDVVFMVLPRVTSGNRRDHRHCALGRRPSAISCRRTGLNGRRSASSGRPALLAPREPVVLDLRAAAPRPGRSRPGPCRP